MVDFGYNNNAIRNQKHFRPIGNGNVADSCMIALTDKQIPCWKPKKELNFKCKSWIKKLINSCFSQNTTKHKLTADLIYLCYFVYLYKILNRYWANQLDIFIATSTKRATFIATFLFPWDWPSREYTWTLIWKNLSDCFSPLSPQAE